MKEFTEAEMEDILIEKRRNQECIDGVMLLILLIMNGILLPLIYKEVTLSGSNNIIKTAVLVNIGYYFLKQLFYKEADSWDSLEFFWNLVIFWLIVALVGGFFVAVITNLELRSVNIYLLKIIITFIITLISLLIIMIIEEIQNQIRYECEKLELDGYTQKAYELTENTKYFICFIIILTIVAAIITLMGRDNLLAINWEKPIVYLGTPYCIAILGILLRRSY